MIFVNKLLHNRDVDSISISLASSECIRKWAERVLPNGKIFSQVTTAQTVNYKTLKPEKGGLFCERIFGPIKDFECACGKKPTKNQKIFCLSCNVEFTSSQVRRYRLGYIELNSSVTHVWYLKSIPSYISILLDMSKKKVENIAYCIETISPNVMLKNTDLSLNYLDNIKFNTRIIHRKKLKKTNKKFSLKLNNIIQKSVINLMVFAERKDLWLKKYKSFILPINLIKKYTGFPLTSITPVSESNSVTNDDEKFCIFLIKQLSQQKLWNNFLSSKYSNFIKQSSLLLNYDKKSLINHLFFRAWPLNFLFFGNNLKKKKILTFHSLVPLGIYLIKLNKFSKLKLKFLRNYSFKLLKQKKPASLMKQTVRENRLAKNLNIENQLLHEKNLKMQNNAQKNIDTKLIGLKKKTFNNFYCISQTFLWEVDEDWNAFRGYMSTNIKKKDKKIFLYKDRINDEFNNSIEFPITGAETIKNLLIQYDPVSQCPLLEAHLKNKLFTLNEEIGRLEESYKFNLLWKPDRIAFEKLLLKRIEILRRLKVVRSFIIHYHRTKARPDWMILSTLPVLPPTLRPIIQLDDNQVAVSDLNKLYQKVIFRNQRIQRYKKNYYSINNTSEMRYAQRLLQEAVDALIENGKGGSIPITAPNNRPLKSLSDILKGKKGRFRQNLLGKRVDYSGRSVIVVGPQLKLYECGLPKEMAIELFQPFLIRRLIAKKFTKTILKAKQLIKKEHPIIWQILPNLIQNLPVLLNRAPTLHRLGIQAFKPKLVEGRAILLHPLVCTAFNADFDGDQMAVHVPLSSQARTEAWKLMWSPNNLLSPATGQPIVVPSQDMILGCYYLTTTDLTQTQSVLLKKTQLSSMRIESASQLLLSTKRAESFTNKLLNGTKNQVNSFSEAVSLTNDKNQNFQNIMLRSTSSRLFSTSQRNQYFLNFNEVLKKYFQNKVQLHNPIWVNFNNNFEIGNNLEKPLEIRIEYTGNFLHIYCKYLSRFSSYWKPVNHFIRTTPGRVLLNEAIFKGLNFV
jgi:DNA-directed RNA polymerase beta' subunit